MQIKVEISLQTVYLSIYISLDICIYIYSIYIYVCLCIYLSFCISVYIAIYLSSIQKNNNYDDIQMKTIYSNDHNLNI